VNDTQAEILNHLSLDDLHTMCYTNKTMLYVWQHDKRLSSKLSVYRFVNDLRNKNEISLYPVKEITFNHFYDSIKPYTSSIVCGDIYITMKNIKYLVLRY